MIIQSNGYWDSGDGDVGVWYDTRYFFRVHQGTGRGSGSGRGQKDGSDQPDQSVVHVTTNNVNDEMLVINQYI